MIKLVLSASCFKSNMFHRPMPISTADAHRFVTEASLNTVSLHATSINDVKMSVLGTWLV